MSPSKPQGWGRDKERTSPRDDPGYASAVKRRGGPCQGLASVDVRNLKQCEHVRVAEPNIDSQTAEAAPRMKWKTNEATASNSRMWMKNAVTWNTKKPPSHSRSNITPIARNILSPLSIFDKFAAPF
jgi:hypothetical protein